MIFAFLISFLSFFKINLVGELYVTEIILLSYLLFSSRKSDFLSEPIPKKIIQLGVLWLLSQIVTDLIRGTPSANYLRGWAAIVFFLADFCALYITVRLKPEVLKVLIAGSALGAIFSVIVLPTEYSEVEPWKFGYGIPVTTLVFLYLSAESRFNKKSSYLLLVALGVLSIYLNSRSLGGMTILVATVLYFSQTHYFKNYALSNNKINYPIVLTVIFVPICIILSTYQLAAESGLLPEKVYEKYQTSKSSKFGLPGLIVGGRVEILISSQAVMDSPIIGHGSWAENRKYADMLYFVSDQLGLEVNEAAIEYGAELSDLIPTHSVIMQAWVWAGVLGAVFWLYILKFIAKNTLITIISTVPLKPIIVFIGISSVWNLLFSPFGATARFSWAIGLVLLSIGNLVSDNTRDQVANDDISLPVKN